MVIFLTMDQCVLVFKFQLVSPSILLRVTNKFWLKGAYKNCQNSFLSQLKKSTIE